MGTLISGLPANARTVFATGGNIRLLFESDGIERIYVMDGVNAYQAGIDSPAAVPTFNANIAGALDASANYYSQSTYRRSIHGIVGNGSGTSLVMTSGAVPNDGIRVNVPAETVQLGIDQAEMYRTLGGAVAFFYEGRKAYTGSAITYDHIIADSALGASLKTDNNVPEARPYIRFFGGHLWLWGSKTYDTGTVALAASTTLTGSGTAFTKGMVGKRFQADQDGTKYYTIAAYVSATELTLDSAYVGSTGAGKTYTISLEPLVLRMSKIDSSANLLLESFPASNYGVAGGGADDNQKPTALGQTASLLLPQTNYNTYYTMPQGANTFYPMKLLHPGVGSMGQAMGVNATGTGDWIWMDQNAGIRRSTGAKGEPYDLSKFFIANILDGTHDGIHNDIIVDTSKYADFHAIFYGPRNWYMLFVTLLGATYPNACLICDMNINPTGDPSRPSPWMLWTGFTALCSGMRPINGILRPHIGDDLGFIWQLDIGTNDGVPSGTKTGVVASATTTTLTITGASLYTTGDGLKGVKVRTYNPTTEALINDVVIQSNTSDTITVTSWDDSTPSAADLVKIGGIVWERYGKASHDGHPKDPKQTNYLDITTDKASSSRYLKVHHFVDLNSSAVIATGRKIDVSLNTMPDTIPDEATGHYHQHKYSNVNPDEPITIRNIVRDVSLEGRK